MDPTNEVMTHLTTGAVVVYTIEWLKRWPAFRWLTADSGMVNRVVSAVAAAMIAFGISVTGDAASGWSIGIPPVATLAASGWEFVKQFMVQQVLYQGVVEPRQIRLTMSQVKAIDASGSAESN